jgi:hypothetical protein
MTSFHLVSSTVVFAWPRHGIYVKYIYNPSQHKHSAVNQQCQPPPPLTLWVHLCLRNSGLCTLLRVSSSHSWLCQQIHTTFTCVHVLCMFQLPLSRNWSCMFCVLYCGPNKNTCRHFSFILLLIRTHRREIIFIEKYPGFKSRPLYILHLQQVQARSSYHT